MGHLGPDKHLNVPAAVSRDYNQRELEAESVAFLVCERNGVKSRSEAYLKDHVKDDTTIDRLDLYQVMRAAGQIETMLHLAAHASFDKPRGVRR